MAIVAGPANAKGLTHEQRQFDALRKQNTSVKSRVFLTLLLR